MPLNTLRAVTLALFASTVLVCMLLANLESVSDTVAGKTKGETGENCVKSAASQLQPQQ